MVKWWDLDNQHCFKTMVGHRTEVCIASWAPEKNEKAKDGFYFSLLGLFLLLTDLCSVLRDTEVGWEEVVAAIETVVAFLV
jgi:hypothetical protein